jgi:hypothetical protein
MSIDAVVIGRHPDRRRAEDDGEEERRNAIHLRFGYSDRTADPPNGSGAVVHVELAVLLGSWAGWEYASSSLALYMVNAGPLHTAANGYASVVSQLGIHARASTQAAGNGCA